MIKASYPFEYVCVYAMQVPMEQGEAFAYLALDRYSKYALTLDVEPGMSMEGLLKNIDLLLHHEVFSNRPHRAFTLVFDRYDEHRKAIEALIEPFGGKMMVDARLVAAELRPVVENFYQHIRPQAESDPTLN